jgi:YggT family protein
MGERGAGTGDNLRALARHRQPTHIVLVITSLLSQAVHIYSLIVLASVIVSWVAPEAHHPALELLRSVTEPVFDKVRAVVPPVGGFDLSPMIVLLALNLLQHFI